MHGTLYIIATPIGNLQDISFRSVETLREVDLILCEDTRVSQKLLNQYSIQRPVKSFHQHSETSQCDKLIERMLNGEQIALLSDAGTPLIRDAGKILVEKARCSGIRIVPLPGACAVTTALSACDFGGDCFVFEGFLPSKRSSRVKHLKRLSHDHRVQVFFEAPHRLLESLKDIKETFGTGRKLCLAKELTKLHEALVHGTADEILAWLQEDIARCKGEFVLIVESGKEQDKGSVTMPLHELLDILSENLPPSSAAKIAAKLSKLPRRELYRKE